MTTNDAVQDALRRASATIRDLQARLASAQAAASAASAEPLAVVGLACRLPGGVTGPEQYWDLLTEGRLAVGPVPEWRWAGRPPAVGGGQYAGTVDDVSGFDPAFFGIGEADARVMDPQQRMMLTICWEAVERWGRVPARLVDSDTGVFLGVGHQDYLTALLAAEVPVTGQVGPGNARSIVGNRVSYLFGFRGPSIVVDTACSSSLVAVHLAAQSLRAGECSAAIAGGVNLILAPESTLVTGRALPLAPDGRTKAFDAEANGMVRGEGAGVIVLRRLADALADGDHVHAVLLATGTNQDGRTNGLTAPSPVAQELLLRRVLTQSGLAPAQVTYVETHGTGTPLGDPIEFEAVQRVYGAPGDAPTCWLGSVKPNLGHLESAAGIASLIKAVLAVERAVIPGQVCLDTVNPEIRLEGTRFELPRRAVEWGGESRGAAVSSFGFGGTNAHIVLASHPGPQSVCEGAAGGPVVLPVSGHTPAALRQALERYASLSSGPRTARTVAGAAARRRTHFGYRRAVVAGGDSWAAQVAAASEEPSRARPALAGRTAFVFGGQGTAWSPAVLLEPEVVAEAALWDQECTDSGAPPVSPVLAGLARDPSLLADTRTAQLAIAVVEAAMANRLRDLGLLPDLVLGHSLGEVVAALVAGRLHRADAARLIRARSDLQHEHVSRGAMASFRASRDEVEQLLRGRRDDRVGIAADNSSRAVVVAGPRDAVLGLLEVSGLTSRLLDTGYAFHSPALAAVPGTTGLADPGRPGSDGIELVSTVSGLRDGTQPLPRDRWLRNMVDPVRFHDAVTTAIEAGVTRFVEIAPSPALATHLVRTADDAGVEVVVLGAGPGDRPLADRLAETLARAWEAGAEVDWAGMYPTTAVVPDLPTSAFDSSPYWFREDSTPRTAGRTDGHAGAEALDAAALEAWIQALVAEVAGFASAAEVDTGLPATELDVDSAEFVEVKNRLEDRLRVAVPITLLLDGSSIAEVSRELAGAPSPEGHRGPARPEPAGLLDLLEGRSVEELSEQELDRLLAAHEPAGPAPAAPDWIGGTR